MARDTGFPAADAQSDFLRSRRARSLTAVARRLRREPGDVNVILPFEEVVQALGRTGERSLGLKVVPLDHIVGTVDRTHDFDRNFRPTSGRVRSRSKCRSTSWRGRARWPCRMPGMRRPRRRPTRN